MLGDIKAELRASLKANDDTTGEALQATTFLLTLEVTMGCDIHLVLERKYKGQWVGIEMNKSPSERNYKRFGLLAGVRCEGPDPRGTPDDASLLAQMHIERWDGDGHSHSWCTLQEYVQACLASERDPEKMLDENDPRTQDPYEHYFGLYPEDREDGEGNEIEHRVVFWFDN